MQIMTITMTIKLLTRDKDEVLKVVLVTEQDCIALLVFQFIISVRVPT